MFKKKKTKTKPNLKNNNKKTLPEHMVYLLLTKYTFKKCIPATKSFICQEFQFLSIYKSIFT